MVWAIKKDLYFMGLAGNHPSKYVMKMGGGKQIAQILNLNDIDDKEYESNLGKWTVSEIDDYIIA